MGSFDGAEVCELVGIYILCFLAKLINKKDCGLYRDDVLLILQNVNGQQIDWMHKNIIKTIKGIGFAIDVETNLKIVDFLDTTFNLNNGTYRPYKKPNDLLLYINKSSNHPPQIINQLPKIINERYLEISPMKKFLTHPNINTKKSLETVDTPIWNYSLIKPVTTMQKEIGSITSFGLIRLSAEQFPQMLEIGLSNYYVTTSHPPTSSTKCLIRTPWR